MQDLQQFKQQDTQPAYIEEEGDFYLIDQFLSLSTTNDCTSVSFMALSISLNQRYIIPQIDPYIIDRKIIHFETKKCLLRTLKTPNFQIDTRVPLPIMNKIQKLIFYQQNFHRKDMKKLARCSFQSLLHLVLTNCNIDDEGIIQLSHSKFPQLQIFNIKGNPISNRGIKIFMASCSHQLQILIDLNINTLQSIRFLSKKSILGLLDNAKRMMNIFNPTKIRNYLKKEMQIMLDEAQITPNWPFNH